MHHSRIWIPFFEIKARKLFFFPAFESPLEVPTVRVRITSLLVLLPFHFAGNKETPQIKLKPFKGHPPHIRFKEGDDNIWGSNVGDPFLFLSHSHVRKLISHLISFTINMIQRASRGFNQRLAFLYEDLIG